MPTVFSEIRGYRVFFFSLDRGEPIHVHVARQNGHAKFWLSPLALANSRNFGSHELTEIRKLIAANDEEIRRKWYEHFGC
jgi:hypothetical protein